MHSYLQQTSIITKVWLDLTETPSDELYTPTKLNMELASRFVHLATMTLSHDLPHHFPQPETLVVPLDSA